jgi:hypothetical protein
MCQTSRRYRFPIGCWGPLSRFHAVPSAAEGDRRSTGTRPRHIASGAAPGRSAGSLQGGEGRCLSASTDVTGLSGVLCGGSRPGARGCPVPGPRISLAGDDGLRDEGVTTPVRLARTLSECGIATRDVAPSDPCHPRARGGPSWTVGSPFSVAVNRLYREELFLSRCGRLGALGLGAGRRAIARLRASCDRVFA